MAYRVDITVTKGGSVVIVQDGELIHTITDSQIVTVDDPTRGRETVVNKRADHLAWGPGDLEVIPPDENE